MIDTGGHPEKIRILVLDEQPLLRHGISAYLNSQPDMVVCGEADSLPSAGTKIAECQPQLLVTELRLGAGDSLKLLKRLKADNRALRIMVYSAFDESIFAERAIRAGAGGYVMKKAPREELAAAIRDIVKDGIYVSREVALSGFRKSLRRQPQNSRSPRSANRLENLSDREMHIFQLVGSGLGTREIAQSLHLSVKTVESHRENIKRKLRLSSGARSCVSAPPNGWRKPAACVGLANYGSTSSRNANRLLQESLKNCIDAMNNNRTWLRCPTRRHYVRNKGSIKDFPQHEGSAGNRGALFAFVVAGVSPAIAAGTAAATAFSLPAESVIEGRAPASPAFRRISPLGVEMLRSPDAVADWRG